MINSSSLLKDNAPSEISQFISSCSSEDDLIQKLGNNSPLLFAVLQNIKVEGNESLAARLLIRLNTSDLMNPEVKKVETVLRNRGMLDHSFEADIILKDEVGSPQQKVKSLIVAHKAILALESPYFRAMNEYDFQQNKFVIKNKDLEISPEAYQLVVDYLYLSDEQRETFLSTVDKSLLTHIAKLADYWQIDELKVRCDDELCNSLVEFNIEQSDMKGWKKQASLFPKFVQLLKFINRVAEDGDFASVIEKMHTFEGAGQLATNCTSKEIEAFATLKSVFGQVFRPPPGIFGKTEWEQTFPITIIGDIPPLPSNIHAVLDKQDPWEPNKKLKDTCKLFLRPEKAILHTMQGDKEIVLGFDGLEELAQNATDPKRRAYFAGCWDEMKNQLNQTVESSRWVLIRNEIIPGTRDLDFKEQEDLLQGNFEAPKVMDAIFLNMITFASEGTRLYSHDPYVDNTLDDAPLNEDEEFDWDEILRNDPSSNHYSWTFTSCQEIYGNKHMGVGGLDIHGKLRVSTCILPYRDVGMTAVWNFQKT